ncbi:hypothetical protein DIPPA_17630 [Diplonema papillatum]|nr:hypothetical protein DIPPA_17630 [Diplonema papillatum]
MRQGRRLATLIEAHAPRPVARRTISLTNGRSRSSAASFSVADRSAWCALSRL